MKTEAAVVKKTPVTMIARERLPVPISKKSRWENGWSIERKTATKLG
jgi:hypothetical protein